MAVSQHSSGDMSVDIAVGELFIAYQDYGFWIWNDATYNLVVATADPSNPRIDAIVAYVDLSVVSSVSNNNPGALKFMDVAGTPAGSPVAPNNTVIQAAVGAGNPFYILDTPTVRAATAQILTADLNSQRTQLQIGSAAKFGFFIPGYQSVANDVSWNPIAPATQTMKQLYIHVKSAPVGSGATVRIYNITQSHDVASVTISAGGTDANTTSMTNATINAGDVLRADITLQGSTTPASDFSAILT